MDAVPEKALITPRRKATPPGGIGKQVAQHRIVVERPSQHFARLWDVGCCEADGIGAAAHGRAFVVPQPTSDTVWLVVASGASTALRSTPMIFPRRTNRVTSPPM